MLKRAVLVVCVFVLYLILFIEVLSSEVAAFIGSVAATVLTVFLYTRLARKAGV